MNIIKAKYEIIEQQYNDDLLKDMFKHIELCGRTCYKSEDKITDTSYEKFIKMLEDSEHGAMLEHGTVYLTIPVESPLDDPQYIFKTDIVNFFKHNKYSEVNEESVKSYLSIYYITTNWRVIFEHKDELMCKNIFENFHIEKESLEKSILQFITKPTEHHEKRYTVKFTYHLAVARDINRHRVQSIGEESTRYCNYSKEKFGGELNYIQPVFISDEEKQYLNNKNEQLSFQSMCNQIGAGINYSSFAAIDYFIFALEACEFSYMNLIRLGWKPQQASLVLPLDTKTESVHTAFASDWACFFNLRALGTTGAPRPSAKEVAWPLMKDFLNRNWITLDMINEDKYNQIKEKYINIEDYIKL